jgi:hypothetical protein
MKLRIPFKKIAFYLILFIVLILMFLFVGNSKKSQNILWGVNFSQKQSQDLGLDWKENYLAILDDLKFKNIKILTHWNFLEPQRDEYYFDDLDWQINEAEKRGVKVILVLGMKTGRWPECHIPDWASKLSKEEQQKEILELVSLVVKRYKNSDAVFRWQAENEPFFSFGFCPWKIDENFVREEVKVIKNLDDKNREIIVSDSGELSFWRKAASIGDIVGITMYRKVWSGETKTYWKIPLNSTFYYRKSQLIKKFFGKKVIVVELQAEPWPPKFLTESSLKEQRKTMTFENFKKIIEFAQKTGFNEFYFWGAEWWYWVKTNFPQDDNSLIWDYVKDYIKRD